MSLVQLRIGFLCAAVGAASTSAAAQGPLPDSSKVYTFVERMPVYPGGRGYLILLTDLRREFGVASGAAGCLAPAAPVNVNLLVGPSGVIYRADFVNNLIQAGHTAPAHKGTRPATTVATTPPGPALPAACEAALQVAVRRLPRLQPGQQRERRVTVQLTLPLVPRP